MSTPEELKVYASNKRSNYSQEIKVPFGTNMYFVSDLLTQNWSTLSTHAFEEEAKGVRNIKLPVETELTEMTNGDIVRLVRAASDKDQANNDVYIQIINRINAGTITTTEEIDSEWPTLVDGYQNRRILNPSLEALNEKLGEVNSKIPAKREISSFIPTLGASEGTKLSDDRDTNLVMPIDVKSSPGAINSGAGAVYIDYADDIDVMQNLVVIGPFRGSFSGTSNFTDTKTITASGIIPAGKYFKIRTVIENGKAEFTAGKGQKIIL